MHEPAWWAEPCRVPQTEIALAARYRQQQLTKPEGSLGALETLVERLAGLQGCVCPQVHRPWLTLFVGDHGVAAEGVSAYPQSVTVQMLRNFMAGGAALSVLAKAQNIPWAVVDLGTVAPNLNLPSVAHLNLGLGTANFLYEPAMTVTQCHAALNAGWEAVQAAVQHQADLFLAAEMGIGNTTAAAAIACALTELSPEYLAGPGTGLDAQGVLRKQQVIDKALRRHHKALTNPWETLRCLGGFELAALSGAYIACAQLGIPAVVDGFICTAAALCAVRLNPACLPWLIFSHAGAERGHRLLLEQLQATPLLSLGLRLGEGTGAALALPIIRLACTLHQQMATFDEAAVAGRVS